MASSCVHRHGFICMNECVSVQLHSTCNLFKLHVVWFSFCSVHKKRKAMTSSAKFVGNLNVSWSFHSYSCPHILFCVCIYLLTDNLIITQAPFTRVRTNFCTNKKFQARFHLAFTRDRWNWTNF